MLDFIRAFIKIFHWLLRAEIVKKKNKNSINRVHSSLKQHCSVYESKVLQVIPDGVRLERLRKSTLFWWTEISIFNQSQIGTFFDVYSRNLLLLSYLEFCFSWLSWPEFSSDYGLRTPREEIALHYTAENSIPNF